MSDTAEVTPPTREEQHAVPSESGDRTYPNPQPAKQYPGNDGKGN